MNVELETWNQFCLLCNWDAILGGNFDCLQLLGKF